MNYYYITKLELIVSDEKPKRGEIYVDDIFQIRECITDT